MTNKICSKCGKVYEHIEAYWIADCHCGSPVVSSEDYAANLAASCYAR